MGILLRAAAAWVALLCLLTLAACTKGSSSGGTGGTGGTGNPDLDLTGAFAIDEAGDRIYWAIRDGIRSATLDGNDQRTLFSDLEFTPSKLRLDPSSGRLLWTDHHHIYAASTNGGAIERLGEGDEFDFAPGSQAVYITRPSGIYELRAGGEQLVVNAVVDDDIAVSESANKLYWTQNDAIYEASLADGSPSLVAGTEDSDAIRLDVDPETGDLYYFDSSKTFRLPNGTSTPLRVMDSVRDVSEIDVLAQSRIYWSSVQNQEFWFADLASQPEVLVEQSVAVADFTVDEAHQKLFWASSDGIHVADLNGENATTLLARIHGKIEHVRIDPEGEKLYVRTSGQLARANLDGSGAEIILGQAEDGSRSVGGIDVGADIALDAANQKLYWTIEDPALSSQHAIVRANLDGSNAAQLPGIALTSHSPLDLDPAGGKLYFHTKTGLGRANLDGSGLETFAGSGIGTVVGMRVDSAGQKLYILETKRLLRTDLALQNLEVVLDLPSLSYGLSFDASSGLLYFRAISGELHSLDVATPGATPTQVTLPAALSTVTGSFSVTNGTLYFGTNQSHVARVELAGPSDAPLDILLPRVAGPSSVAVIGDTLYWSDEHASWIAAANLDGRSARVVETTAVWGELRPDPAGGGLFFARESGLFRLDLATHAIDELDTKRVRSLIASPTDLYYIPLDAQGFRLKSPAISKWSAGESSSLIDQDAWKGGKPRSLAWGEDRVYCVDDVAMLSSVSSDGATIEHLALVPGAKASLSAGHFLFSTRAFYYVVSNAIQRFSVPDSPRLKLLFSLRE